MALLGDSQAWNCSNPEREYLEIPCVLIGHDVVDLYPLGQACVAKLGIGNVRKLAGCEVDPVCETVGAAR